MKIIFSRKGFDSSYGGGASPIMPNGDLLSIPIPANDKEKGILYDDLKYKDRSYLTIMKELGMKIPAKKKTHFDPDLIHDAYPRKKNWKAVFGQHGAALTHLQNKQVQVGDIFLFFGSFKRTYLDKGRLVFEKDYERHIIFAYLKIGEILSSFPPSAKYTSIYSNHPHLENANIYHPRNTLYIGSEWGTFKYHENLVLTRSGFPKSNWSLPMMFHPDNGVTISRHSAKDIEVRDQQLILRSRGIGQDFVVSEHKEISKWALNLIDTTPKM